MASVIGVMKFYGKICNFFIVKMKKGLLLFFWLVMLWSLGEVAVVALVSKL